MRAVFKLYPLALALALLAGCASSPTTPVAVKPASTPTAFTQAHTLAQADARGNAGQIEALLASLDDASLARHTAALAANDPLYAFAARAMLRRGLNPPHPFDHGWDFSQRPTADADGYRPPNRLAVLLPLSGSMANAAKPVRDGLLAAYHAEQRRRPPLRFYDTHAGVLAAYQRAVNEGADYVIGPLQRAEVDQLFARGDLPVPVLALNRGEREPVRGSVGFALAPEDEGVAAAEWLIAQNAPRVLLLGARDETFQRTAQAFAQRLAARGGSVVASIALGNPSALDAALAAAGSKGAVDAIYFLGRGDEVLAAMPAIARQPALAQSRRIAASQINQGLDKAEDIHQLDGIIFPAESLQTRSLPGLPANPGALTPTARGAAARLFAFGYDAWLVSAYLERLANSREGGLAGATGVLKLDGFGQVMRTAEWSVLRGGVALPYGGR